MSQTIWKYPLPMAPRFSLSLPRDGQILTLQAQHGTPTLWALVFPLYPPVRWEFRWLTTGEEIGSDEALGRYLGTVQVQDMISSMLGSLASPGLVFHLFGRPGDS